MLKRIAVRYLLKFVAISSFEFDFAPLVRYFVPIISPTPVKSNDIGSVMACPKALILSEYFWDFSSTLLKVLKVFLCNVCASLICSGVSSSVSIAL